MDLEQIARETARSIDKRMLGGDIYGTILAALQRARETGAKP